jgi:hypothetical protein
LTRTLKKFKSQPSSNPPPNTKSSDPKLKSYPKPDPCSWPEPVTLLGVSTTQPTNQQTSIGYINTISSNLPNPKPRFTVQEDSNPTCSPKLEPNNKRPLPCTFSLWPFKYPHIHSQTYPILNSKLQVQSYHIPQRPNISKPTYQTIKP